jgi:SagB-type dehydrogenase family enzyme
MSEASWSHLLMAEASDEDYVWELFHENSKTRRYGHHVPNDYVAARMLQLSDALDYEGHVAVELPEPFEGLDAPLSDVITARVTPSQLEPTPLTLSQLSSMLHAGCGLTRSNKTTDFLRPFRTTPSGGALYPLELYLSTKHVNDLDAGLYHYSPSAHQLKRLKSGDFAGTLSPTLVEFQAELVFDASVVFVVTAVFGRSTFKYGARGYRFVFLEAGHVAQNINLAATSLGLGCINLGGFYDRRVDEFLGLDGLNQSTIYMIAVGGRSSVYEEPITRATTARAEPDTSV